MACIYLFLFHFNMASQAMSLQLQDTVQVCINNLWTLLSLILVYIVNKCVALNKWMEFHGYRSAITFGPDCSFTPTWVAIIPCTSCIILILRCINLGFPLHVEFSGIGWQASFSPMDQLQRECFIASMFIENSTIQQAAVFCLDFCGYKPPLPIAFWIDICPLPHPVLWL